MSTKTIRVYEEDVERIKALGNPADVIRKFLDGVSAVSGNPVSGNPKPVSAVSGSILHAEKIELGPPMVGLTQQDVEKLILKERERTREIVSRIMEKHFNSPLTEASLVDGTSGWLVQAKPQDMAAVAKDMQKKEKEWHS